MLYSIELINFSVKSYLFYKAVENSSIFYFYSLDKVSSYYYNYYS